MARLPCRDGGRFAPDGSVQILSAIEIAANPVQRETLAGELVESGLVLRGCQIVARDPWSVGVCWKMHAKRGPAGVAYPLTRTG